MAITSTTTLHKLKIKLAEHQRTSRFIVHHSDEWGAKSDVTTVLQHNLGQAVWAAFDLIQTNYMLVHISSNQLIGNGKKHIWCT